MNQQNSINILKNKLKFSNKSILKLEKFHNYLLNYNRKYNLISKSTEKSIWERHFVDSAQILNHFDHKILRNIADFGSGAGFPGLVIAIFDQNKRFHVKLYEKSPVKRSYLRMIKTKLSLNLSVLENVYCHSIETDLIVCRAFKKLPEIIKISREIVKDAQREINKVSLDSNYSYKLKNSITDNDSKIIILDVKVHGK